MNYKYIYDRLILRCKNREKPNIYTERHHIVPRCMNGGNSDVNLVFLTAKEHFVAHHLLCKIYPANPKLWFAFNAMVHWNSENTKWREDVVKLTAFEYEQLKIRRSALISKLMTGRHVSNETREKLRIASTGRIKTDETKRKLSVSNKKVKHSPEWNRKVSEGLKCYKCTSEHAKHISEAKKGRHIKYNMKSAERFQHQDGIKNMQAIKCYADGVLIGCKKQFIPFLAEKIGISHGSRKWAKIMPYIIENEYHIQIDKLKEFVKMTLK